MNWRSTLMRLMLISLGVAAVAGAMGVLVGSGEMIGRVAGTAFATGVAALLLMGALHTTEKSGDHATAITATGVIVLDYLLIITMIWLEPIWRHQSYRIEERLVGTIWWVALLGGISCFILRTHHVHPLPTKIAAKIGLISAVVLLMLLLLSTWFPWSSSFSPKLWAWAGVLACTAPLATASAVNIQGKERKLHRYLGVVVAAGTWIFGWLIVAIYPDLFRDEHALPSKIFFTLLSLSALLAHLNLSLLTPLKSSQKWLVWLTIFGAVVTVVCVNFLIWQQGRADKEWLGRLTAAAAIPTGCGTIALLLLSRLNRKMTGKVPIFSAFGELHLTCPRCGKAQVVSKGLSECSGCRLRFRIELIEPRCHVCDYVLFDLKGDKCPECGSKVEVKATGSGGEATSLIK